MWSPHCDAVPGGAHSAAKQTHLLGHPWSAPVFAAKLSSLPGQLTHQARMHPFHHQAGGNHLLMPSRHPSMLPFQVLHMESGSRSACPGLGSAQGRVSQLFPRLVPMPGPIPFPIPWHGRLPLPDPVALHAPSHGESRTLAFIFRMLSSLSFTSLKSPWLCSSWPSPTMPLSLLGLH